MLPLKDAGAYANKENKEDTQSEEVLELQESDKQRSGRKSTRT